MGKIGPSFKTQMGSLHTPCVTVEKSNHLLICRMRDCPINKAFRSRPIIQIHLWLFLCLRTLSKLQSKMAASEKLLKTIPLLTSRRFNSTSTPPPNTLLTVNTTIWKCTLFTQQLTQLLSAFLALCSIVYMVVKGTTFSWTNSTRTILLRVLRVIIIFLLQLQMAVLLIKSIWEASSTAFTKMYSGAMTDLWPLLPALKVSNGLSSLKSNLSQKPSLNSGTISGRTISTSL